MFRNKNIVDLISEILGFPKDYSHNQVNIGFNCPKCDNGRNRFKLAINTDKDVFQCWVCAYRGRLKKLVYDYGSERQKIQFLKLHGKPTPVLYTPVDTSQEVLSISSFRSLRFNWKYSLTYTASKKYLRSRNITQDIIDKWDICYAEEGKYKNRVIVPSKSVDGRLEYFVARDIFDTDHNKYKNPNVPKQEIIFGEKFIDWKKPVVLTEGVFDAIVLYNAVPILGTRIENHKKLVKKIMQNKTPIILGFDNDKPGQKGVQKIGKFLNDLNITVYTLPKNKYNDLAQAYQQEGKEFVISLLRGIKQYDELALAVESLMENG